MKKHLKIIAIIIFFYQVYVNKNLIIEATIETSNLWIKKIIPSIFPILILTDLTISSNLPNFIINYLGIFISKYFKINNISLYPFIISSFTGCPSNAKYIKDLLDLQIISIQDAEQIITYCYLYNPLLIISLTPKLILQDKIFLILGNLLINIIISIIFVNKKTMKVKIKPPKFDLIKTINNSINVLISIYGILLLFSIIIKITKIKNPIIIGSLEIMNGLSNISTNNLYIYSILLSFGGLSIIYQIKTILKDYNINYTKFYQARIIHIILFIVLTKIYLLFN